MRPPGLDIVSGPAIYAVRNLTPVGDLLQAATSKVAGYFADGFERAGRSEVDSANGGIGGTAMLSVGGGGFAGAIKGIRSLATDFNPIRKFDRKEITKGFQDHHIISDKNNLTKNHELLSLSGADLQARSNKIFLPKAPGSHPTRSLHDGRHTNAVSENLANQMDAVVEAGKRNGWTEQQYRKALDAITAQERALLKSGDRGLNKIARPWSK
ncbi:AHH domain-containing protein [Massilia sp. H6]|uniref:AHH domain-containing protein n=1 Tax=Massilia sp. H6 TaxID=2970464 RepID=UPI002168DC3F|nr:AHH domain-containing protein [Massilia sp. H6]UVW28437.1 AHH domain-containing protein [Massilia sp. H6]